MISSLRSLTTSPWTTILVFRRKTMGFGAVLCISNVKSDTVRLIDAKQNMVGVVSKSEAIRLADEAELDLVILSTEADLPVLKIMDYKYVFC
ncbi:hypothetical protein COP2_020327 [Malus domestica]